MTFLDHAGDNGLCADERSYEVDVYNLAEVFNVHLFHGDTLDDTCIVYEDVDTAEFLFDVGDHSLYAFFVGDVAHVACGVDTGFFIVGHTHIHRGLGIAVEYNLSASLVESFGDSETDAIDTTGNEGYFTLK